MNTILLSADRGLRTTGTLSDATGCAFAAVDGETRRGSDRALHSSENTRKAEID